MYDDKSLERYARNILIEKIGREGQKKFLNAKILVAGAGGLGSSVISNLASIGIGTLGIIDYDNLEITNLNRQFIHKIENIGQKKVESAAQWIKLYNPEINVRTYDIKLDESNYANILKPYDLVIDCFDSFESKFGLNHACINSGKILIHGGVTAFAGQVMTIIPDKSACLSCLFPEYDKNKSVFGIISPTVNVIGSIQAMESVKIILNWENILSDTLLSYDGINNNFRKIKINKQKNCPICSKLYQFY